MESSMVFLLIISWGWFYEVVLLCFYLNISWRWLCKIPFFVQINVWYKSLSSEFYNYSVGVKVFSLQLQGKTGRNLILKCLNTIAVSEGRIFINDKVAVKVNAISLCTNRSRTLTVSGICFCIARWRRVTHDLARLEACVKASFFLA